MDFRVGLGYDIHRLVKGRKLILGGVDIEYPLGLKGHSDADVILHAVCDALLGGIGAGDIGEHFPNTDLKYKGIASRMLVQEVVALVIKKGYKVNNLDIVVQADEPNLKEYKPMMKLAIAQMLGIDPEDVGLKATTLEGMGSAKKGIAAYAVVSLIKR